MTQQTSLNPFAVLGNTIALYGIYTIGSTLMMNLKRDDQLIHSTYQPSLKKIQAVAEQAFHHLARYLLGVSGMLIGLHIATVGNHEGLLRATITGISKINPELLGYLFTSAISQILKCPSQESTQNT